MTAIINKRILDYMDQWMMSQGYQKTEAEAQCLKTYRNDMIISGLSTAGLFGYFGYQTLDVNQLFGPRQKPFEFLLTFSALSGVAFTTTYFGASLASRRCFDCLLKTNGEDQKLGNLLEELLRAHHPKAENILKDNDRITQNNKVESTSNSHTDGNKTDTTV